MTRLKQTSLPGTASFTVGMQSATPTPRPTGSTATLLTFPSVFGPVKTPVRSFVPRSTGAAGLARLENSMPRSFVPMRILLNLS